MTRPKKGTRAGELATQKWKETMRLRYGGAEGFHRKMQLMGKKGGAASKGGGFASMKVGADGLTGFERARKAGARGGKISRRGPAKKKGLDHANND